MCLKRRWLETMLVEDVVVVVMYFGRERMTRATYGRLHLIHRVPGNTREGGLTLKDLEIRQI